MTHTLVILQNKAVRIISGKQYFQIYGQEPGPLPSSEPPYKKLEILKIHDIYELSISNYVYSTLTFDSPAIFDNWFQYAHEIHDHTTRVSTDVGKVILMLVMFNSPFLFTPKERIIFMAVK